MNQRAPSSFSDSQQTSQPRRDYNRWVANETLEDFALRHTARRARRWSFTRIANTALGTSSFLVLELLGATIALNYGVVNSLWAIGVVCLLLFLTGLPISYYATKYAVDIDLLTRGAGFGYIGSTISSLIYASFTFIFFALEAAIMASALDLLLGVPLWLGYIISAIIVIPLVTHGIARVSRFQIVTQPIWLLLQIAPIIYVAQHPSNIFDEWLAFSGISENSKNVFNWVTFGSATAVLFSLVAQIGEQVDFLRFLPEPEKKDKKKWITSVICAGPGWVFFGAIKLTLGTMLAYLLISKGFSPEKASDPTEMYRMTFGFFTDSDKLALIVAAIFVIVCQTKINVANAYAGSLAWSNFFSRLTHHHPGRIVWLIFNVSIALMLMELGVHRAIDTVLHHYSAFVLAWLGSIVADLVINKPLKLSPSFIEFKRSNLHDINPVGVVSTLLAAIIGITLSAGVFGDELAAFSSFVALLLPFLTVPVIAYLTKGKYYIVKSPQSEKTDLSIQLENHLCSVCQNKFDIEDIAKCPAYGGNICSLCCALETRCKDQCRPEAHIGFQLDDWFRSRLPNNLYTLIIGPLGQFSAIFFTISLITLSIFYLSYLPLSNDSTADLTSVWKMLGTVFTLLLILLGVIVWLFVLAQKATRFALEETRFQSKKLTNEFNAHKKTLKALDNARKSADSANVAKSNYVTVLSHELRTPLNVILGYAQILQNDADATTKQRDSLEILRRNSEHLATMIEGLLEISKIEAGKLNLNSDQVRLDLMLGQLAKMFGQQASSKGLAFSYECPANLPNTIKVDEKRLRQILINLLSNAIKFTNSGSIGFSVTYRGHVARFSVTDTGLGIAPDKLQTIFTPFERGDELQNKQIPGSGLGLSICRQLADMMGADIEVSSELGKGSTFTLLLQLSPVTPIPAEPTYVKRPIGYQGRERSVLIVDDNEDHRRLIADLLTPLGFATRQAHDIASLMEATKHPIDLVFLDVRLGSESGWKAAELLRKQFNRLPIIMVSANAREFVNDAPDKRIHDEYIEKPIQLDMLLEKLTDLMYLKWNYQSTQSGPETIDGYNTVHKRSPDGSHNNQKSLNPQRIDTIIQHANTGNLNALKEGIQRAKSEKAISDELADELVALMNKYDFGAITLMLTSIKENYHLDRSSKNES